MQANYALISAVVALTTGLVSNAEAALVERDWLTPGDSHITYDTETGLEWLDVPITKGLSYDEVRRKIANEDPYKLFRFASAEEVRVIQDYISPLLYVENPTIEIQSRFDEVIDKFGATKVNNDGSRELDGFTGTSASATTQVNAYFIQGSSGGSINLSTSVVTSWAAPSTTGSYLVRESAVPIPPAILLFGSGLVAMIGFGNRRNSS